ncbi:hypothetical protein PG996_010784 [Apiospora saccharicola]|uniref:Uncharacterized protein n=1 Tax=Apiospora saccharicola TaxID=335842 RepID=A0ABR1UPL9_9PEZI
MTNRPVNPLPESPWAQHFHPSKDPFFQHGGDGVRHSGLAPQLPYIPWSQIDQEPPQEVQPLPSMQELDTVFYSERNQTHFRAGIPSWRLPSLLSGLSRGGDIEGDPELISVNEDQWPNFLKRSRWFDLRVDGASSVPNPHPEFLNYHNRWWTADNPAIWSKLRIATELVYRILSKIIEERHAWSVYTPCCEMFPNPSWPATNTYPTGWIRSFSARP